MHTTDVDVCNFALGELGHGPVESLNPQAGKAEEACARIYPQARDELLRWRPWPWATKRRRLALLAELDGDTDAYAYRYAYPSDCLFLRGLADGLKTRRPDQGIVFTIEAGDATETPRVVLTDQDDAVAIYTPRMTAVAEMPADFTQALAHLVATRLAVTLTDDERRQARQYELFSQHRLAAWANALHEQHLPESPAPPWVTDR